MQTARTFDPATVSLVAADEPSPCSHPRCDRADEGVCLIAALAADLDAAAKRLGATRFSVEDSGRWVFVRTAFPTVNAAVEFRDAANPSVIALDLHYLSPALRTRVGGGAEVTIFLIDRRDEIGGGK